MTAERNLPVLINAGPLALRRSPGEPGRSSAPQVAVMLPSFDFDRLSLHRHPGLAMHAMHAMHAMSGMTEETVVG
jgi:hypothetical protein